eukprot:6182827-Pleurochrysis_carterae.AAC.1
MAQLHLVVNFTVKANAPTGSAPAIKMIEVFELTDKSNGLLHPNLVDDEINSATLASVKAARIHDYRGYFATSNSLIKIAPKLPSGTPLS